MVANRENVAKVHMRLVSMRNQMIEDLGVIEKFITSAEGVLPKASAVAKKKAKKGKKVAVAA